MANFATDRKDPQVMQLIREHTRGMDIKSIAELHGRTTDAIRPRLEKEKIILWSLLKTP